MYEFIVLLLFVIIWIIFAVTVGTWGAIFGWVPAAVICNLLL